MISDFSKNAVNSIEKTLVDDKIISEDGYLYSFLEGMKTVVEEFKKNEHEIFEELKKEKTKKEM